MCLGEGAVAMKFLKSVFVVLFLVIFFGNTTIWAKEILVARVLGQRVPETDAAVDNFLATAFQVDLDTYGDPPVPADKLLDFQESNPYGTLVGCYNSKGNTGQTCM